MGMDIKFHSYKLHLYHLCITLVLKKFCHDFNMVVIDFVFWTGTVVSFRHFLGEVDRRQATLGIAGH